MVGARRTGREDYQAGWGAEKGRAGLGEVEAGNRRTGPRPLSSLPALCGQ